MNVESRHTQTICVSSYNITLNVKEINENSPFSS